MTEPHFEKKHLEVILCLLLVILTIIPYGQIIHHSFVGYDDDDYVTSNPNIQAGLTSKSIAWAFKMNGYACNWHPLSWISHMIDIELFGMESGLHHLTNLVLHIASTVLLFLVLRTMTGAIWQSGFVAALFALHPLHVESVAWISERKDVLSALFWMLTLGCYVWYTRHRRTGRYLLVVLIFALGLLAKPMLVTLPFALLLLDFWPLKRAPFFEAKESISGRKKRSAAPSAKEQPQVIAQEKKSAVKLLILEKVPLFLLSAASCGITLFAQQKGGSLEPLELLPFADRIANAAVAYGVYIWKLILPINLACFYPFPSAIAWTKVLVLLFFLLAITALSFRLVRVAPYMIVGWLWYLGTLLPVIGIIQVGGQAMADRYSYIPFIGLFLVLAWGIPQLLSSIPHRKAILSTTAVVVLLIFMIMTWKQAGHWKNSIVLFEHAIAVTRNNDIAHSNLGTVLRDIGKTEEAVVHFREALRINPSFPAAHENLGNSLSDLGKFDEAYPHLMMVLRRKQDSPSIHNNIGFFLAQQGKLEEAVHHYEEALRLNPAYIRALNNLEVALAKLGRKSQVIDYYSKALRADPDNFDAHCNLGDVLAEQGRMDEAIFHFREALRINPNNPATHNALGLAFGSKGELGEAEDQFLEALRIKPDDVAARTNLGIAMLRQGRITEGISQFREALRIQPDYLPAQQNLQLVLKMNPAKQ